MDVRCGRCQSEYQVEDANVSDLGTEVRCGDCGHAFVVKRPSSTTRPVKTSPSPDGENAGTWVVETAAGRLLRLRDLTTLHKWIIEHRVGRADRLSRDGDPWQRLGDMSELLPFFDIVDSAERARTADMPMPAPLPAPLAVPALEPPAPLPQPRSPEPSAFETASALAAPARPLAPTKAQTRMATAAPHSPLYDAGADKTVIIRQAPAKRHGFLKLGITVLVAAVVAYLGILWQHHRLISAMISSSGTSESSAPATASVVAPPTPTPRAAQNAEAAEESAETGDANARSPVVEPIADSGPDEKVPLLGKGMKRAAPVRLVVAHKKAPTPATDRAVGSPASAAKSGAPQTLAAQGYVALNHHQPSRAIPLFKRALASNPNNGTALFGLAEAYRSAGHIAPALQAYRRYVELLPSGPDAGSARHSIRVLESKKR
jgi:predicted Zn finger-like uncharacterized protein